MLCLLAAGRFSHLWPFGLGLGLGSCGFSGYGGGSLAVPALVTFGSEGLASNTEAVCAQAWVELDLNKRWFGCLSCSHDTIECTKTNQNQNINFNFQCVDAKSWGKKDVPRVETPNLALAAWWRFYYYFEAWSICISKGAVSPLISPVSTTCPSQLIWRRKEKRGLNELNRRHKTLDWLAGDVKNLETLHKWTTKPN